MTDLKASSPADNPILQYWEAIKSGQVVVGRKVRAQYKKLARDVLEAPGEYEYDADKANHAINFVEHYCKHSQGKLGGQPFILELWQKAATAALFGFVHKIDGTRKYRECILMVAAKMVSRLGAAPLLITCFLPMGSLGRRWSAWLPKEIKQKYSIS